MLHGDSDGQGLVREVRCATWIHWADGVRMGFSFSQKPLGVPVAIDVVVVIIIIIIILVVIVVVKPIFTEPFLHKEANCEVTIFCLCRDKHHHLQLDHPGTLGRQGLLG